MLCDQSELHGKKCQKKDLTENTFAELWSKCIDIPLNHERNQSAFLKKKKKDSDGSVQIKIESLCFSLKEIFLKMDLHRVCFIPVLCFSSSVSEVGQLHRIFLT